MEESKDTSVRVTIKVDGTEIDLNSFAERMLGGGVVGMIKALRGVEDPEKVELKLWVKEKK